LVKGIVQKINKNEQYGLYSFALKGEQGWFSLGKRAPTFREGDSIQFETKQSGKYTDAIDIQPWTDGGSVEAPRIASVGNAPNNSGYRSYGGGKKPFTGGKSQEEKDYWLKKDAAAEVTQRRIEIQAARNAAIETAKALYELDLVAKPKTKAEQYDAYLALIDQIATDFIANTESRLAGSETVEKDSGAKADAEVSSDKFDQDNQTWD
jgi:hypothetical protein